MTPDRAAALAAAPEAPGFFDGFEERRVPVLEGEVFVRIGGSGPPLLLLHGYPQTSAMWHRVAPALARDHTVICPDLRGYGRSSKPASAPDHEPYSKRATGRDLLALLDALGLGRVLIGAHDRGARVAHRLAADHPGRVRALSLLDIAPTREMYAEGGPGFAADYWHWYWLILPAPYPELRIGRDPAGYWLMKCGDQGPGLTPFARPALEEYLDAFTPEAVAASCEDYRAAWTIDRAHDDADPSPLAMPLQALWGADGAIERHFDCLALWRRRAAQVEGRALPGGHYLAEQSPEAVLAAWRPFFAAAPD
jgi:haloacetate dehalogenase